MNRRDPTERRWWATLVGGAVVLGAVLCLLEALRRAVVDVEAAVDRVWTTGKRLAQNTQATHLLNATRARTAAVCDELRATSDLEEGT
ncbi:MAG TPA: hypothetical protein VGV93_08475 [Acidimicrobiales bacterium]|nr:hypothetical protein [Acidimicrobiales bacterium]